MIVSLAEAIRLTGRSRSQLYRDVDAGKVSRTSQTNGKPGFEISELLRAYGQLKGAEKRPETADETVLGQHETLRDTVLFEERIRSLETELRLRDQIAQQFEERLKDKEAIIEGLKNQVLLIEHVKLSHETESETSHEKKGFFRRLFSRA